jgi:hypothetical protein
METASTVGGSVRIRQGRAATVTGTAVGGDMEDQCARL